MSETPIRLAEFAQPFVDAAKSIIDTMARTEVSPQPAELRNDQVSKGDYSSMLGISGDFASEDGRKGSYRGMVVVSFPEVTYLKVASAIFSEEVTEYTDEIADLGAEIVNMIVGNAKAKLDDAGYESNMAIPSSVSGPKHKIRYPGPTTVTIIPMACDLGEFFVEVAYQES